MSQPNRMLQMAQSTGGSPYDEEAYMPGGAVGANRFMASRMQGRMTPQMMEYLHGGYPGYAGKAQSDLGMGGPPAGSDSDMMAIYGPEDQVAYDQQGNPIRLDDPRHPRNQRQGPALNPMLAPSYPQRR